MHSDLVVSRLCSSRPILPPGLVLYSSARVACQGLSLAAAAAGELAADHVLLCRVTLSQSRTIVLPADERPTPSLLTPHRLLVLDPDLILPLWLVTLDVAPAPVAVVAAATSAQVAEPVHAAGSPDVLTPRLIRVRSIAPLNDMARLTSVQEEEGEDFDDEEKEVCARQGKSASHRKAEFRRSQRAQ